MPDIDFQKIELNLIPKKGDDPVVFYASQYETARPFKADLMWGDTAFTPGDDCWAEIDIRKNDDNLVVITEDVVIDNNEVSVILPVQAVTCIGKNIGQVKIYSGEDQFVAAFNFILEVQPDTLAGGVTSDTAIDNLTQQIEDIAEDIAEEVIGENYYNKTETDALLADKADRSELSALASKAELEHAIEEEDAAVKDWVSSHFATPGYVESHYYTKLQVDGIIDNMLPVGSASGNPCTFETDLADALVSLTANIVCGGGGGTPSTPIPIVGHSELNLTRCGVNFADVTEMASANTVVSGDTVTFTATDIFQGSNSCIIKMITGQSVTLSFSELSAGGQIELRKYASDNSVIDTVVIQSSPYTFVVSDSTDHIGILLGNGLRGAGVYVLKQMQVEYSATPSAFEPYNGQTFTVAFGQTVYGGVYDKSGRLTITHGFITYDGSNDEDWGFVDAVNRAYISVSDIDTSTPDNDIADVKANIYVSGAYSGNGNRITGRYNITQINVFDSSVNNISEWRALLSNTPMTVAYELATPIVIDVPSISVFAEKGVNNITSDCGGDVNVSYKDTIQHYIDTRL